MNKKGSILEFKNNCAIVMTEDCKFVFVKRQEKMFIGQQIKFYEKDIIKPRSNILKYTKLVACFIIVLLVSIIPLSSLEFYSSKKTYAYVDIDINPSLEVGISKDNKVLSATSFNEDGKNLLKSLKLKGKTLEVAVDEILNQSRDNGYIKPQTDNYVLIAASLTSEATKDEKELSSLIKSFEGTTGEKGKERIDIEVIYTNSEIKKQANENSISMGKYSLYLKSKDMGLNYSIDDIRNSSVSDIFKKLNMDLIDSENNEFSNIPEINPPSNSAQSNKVNNDSSDKVKVNEPSNSTQSGKVSSDSSNKAQVNSTSNPAQVNDSIDYLPISHWTIGVKYDVGATAEYKNNNYKCIQAHVAEADWSPPSVPALWQKQVPIDSNNTWQTAVNYNVGTLVIYNGNSYKCIQEHMSMQGLEPFNVPALWQKQ